MLFVGDVHGKFDAFESLLYKHLDNKPVFQLGDMGIGFTNWNDGLYSRIVPNHRFIRGNHDDPEKCEKEYNYLGDFGFLKEHNLFYISGAHSIDKHLRTEGRDWWPGEVFNYTQQEECVKLYTEAKPKIVMSHECPNDCVQYVAKYGSSKNNNDSMKMMLNHMLSIHEPEHWIFGHYHITLHFELPDCSTNFHAVDELDTFSL